jgi:hypothetical protein
MLHKYTGLIHISNTEAMTRHSFYIIVLLKYLYLICV